MAEQIEHERGRHRFVLRTETGEAELTYRMNGRTIVFDHTGVPDGLQHRGVGGRLAEAALQYAREQGLTVVPACEFVAGYLREHREYRDLVAGTEKDVSV